ncbi:MAG: TetR/AcrR family transcriptional regulator [Anaerolineales bacterium]
MQSEPASLDPRVLRTRNALKKALIDLAQTQGYENITVKDITERAGLNRTTFYLHFQNKDDLLTNGFGDLWQELTASLPLTALRGSMETPRLIRESLMEKFQRLEKLRPFYRAVLGKNGAPQFKNRWRDEMLTRCKDFLSGSPPQNQKGKMIQEAALAYLSSAYMGLMDWWMNEAPAASPAEMADLLLLISRERPYDIINLKLVSEEGTEIHLNLPGGENDWRV